MCDCTASAYFNFFGNCFCRLLLDTLYSWTPFAPRRLPDSPFRNRALQSCIEIIARNHNWPAPQFRQGRASLLWSHHIPSPDLATKNIPGSSTRLTSLPLVHPPQQSLIAFNIRLPLLLEVSSDQRLSLVVQFKPSRSLQHITSIPDIASCSPPST